MEVTLIERKNQMLRELQDLGWDVEEGNDFLIVNESGFPYLYIQYTQNIHEELDEVSLTRIHNNFGTSFFALTDGEKATISTYNFGYGINFDDVHTVVDFLNIPANDLWNYDIYRRIEQTEILYENAIVDQFIDAAIISETSEPKWQKRFVEFANALYYERYEPTKRTLPLEIIEDLMLDFTVSKNASGGGYGGIHRKLLVKLPNGEEVPFIISLFATAKTINDPVYGNRKGSTQLNIAMIDKTNNAYNLQVDLNKYIDIIDSQYEIWHSGIRSRLKKQYVLQIVQETADFLLDGERVNLGRFPLDSYIDKSVFSTFIENIIVYSYCRKIADIKYRK